MVVPKTEDWKNLFVKYKNLPELWNSTSPLYKEKALKDLAWEEMLEMYQKIDRNATIDQLKKKINNIRTCYRRELKKFLNRQSLGCEETYRPSLWYFYYLEFLKDMWLVDKTSIDDCLEESDSNNYSTIQHIEIERLEKAADYIEEKDDIKNEAQISSDSWGFSKLPECKSETRMVPNTEEWKNLIVKYKNLPELWNSTSPLYKEKTLKEFAWEEMLEIYQKIDRNATIDQLKKKINNIRTCYRRELKKFLNRQSLGCDETYTPSLWYFYYLDFLKNMWLEDETSIDDCFEECDSNNDSTIQHIEIERLREAADYIEEQEDIKNEAQIYSEAWGCSLSKLTENQKLLAKKLIDEILLLGQMNELTVNSFVSTKL